MTEWTRLIPEWFRVADSDGDGRLAGQEAVDFFSRSGLPQAVLR